MPRAKQTDLISTTQGDIAPASEPPEVEARVTQALDIAPGFGSTGSFELAQRVGKMFAASNLVPEQFQNNPANCIIALDLANRMGAAPLMVMQNLFIIHNRPGLSSQFLIATFNGAGGWSKLRYEFSGKENADDWGCRAMATDLATGQVCEGPLVTIALAKSEGWYSKNGSKWRTMPQLMLMYRAAAWFIRSHAPEIAMGMQTAEELRDVIDVTPISNSAVDRLNRSNGESATP